MKITNDSPVCFHCTEAVVAPNFALPSGEGFCSASCEEIAQSEFAEAMGEFEPAEL